MAFASILACAPPALAETPTTPVLGEAELRAAIGSTAARQQQERLDQLLLAGDPVAVLNAVAELGPRPGLGEPGIAYLRHHALMRLAELPADDEARLTLQGYLLMSASIRVWHEDAGHRLAVAAFDPAAAARFSLGRWNQRAWAERTEQDLVAGRSTFLTSWVNASSSTGGRLAPTGIVEALQRAPLEVLQPLKPELRRRLANGEPVAPLAAAVLARSADPLLARAVIRYADTADALAFLGGSLQSFAPEQRFDLLREAADRYDLGSAAMYRLGALESERAQRFLLGRLGSESSGPSAAAALARRAGPRLIGEFADIVRSSPDARTRERAVLALRLVPDKAGHSTLRALATDNRVPAPLKARIARSLP